MAKIPDWYFNDGALAKRTHSGSQLFGQICINCHGKNGNGKGPGSAGLTNVWGHVAVPADLRLQHYRSGPSPNDLFRTIAMGLDGTPMIGFRGALKDEEIWELIAFIESLPQPDAKTGG